ncbi:type VII secretion protein EccB [Cellulomonas gelida]|uniref:Type VII secretion protein EccB n=1 Tax=Cellulomonas gelida TaxID=1712 RepID=A0A4Y3KNE9_9CELL|nr:type VII secretion protein EccB [Cellulomonas gelida]GEA85941.1 hypothetical protein CGE01nite_31920 [Cellulomonas gelida]GGL21657.1 hypothetical protein GCM10009774_09920 [Cellulomonas gelida]
MAAKRDLVEAQSFSRRRLLTAFVSGAPGGQELEPTKPMRGVVAGVMLSVLVVIGSLAWGALRSDPADWSSNRLVVVKGEGTRYVALNDALYPVVNTTSARLAIEAGQFAVVELAPRVIAGTERRETIGIVGAPDAPPRPEALVATGWTACVAPDEGTPAVSTSVGAEVDTEAGGAVVAESGGETFVVTGGLRHRVSEADLSSVLRAVGLETAPRVEVPGAWLNLFPEGTDLAPLTIDGAGRPAPSRAGLGDLDVGTVVRVAGAGSADRWYVVDRRGDLAVLSEFATELYQLGQPDAQEVTRTPAQVKDAGTATTSVAPADWPSEPVAAVAGERVPCAVLTTGPEAGVELVSTDEPPAPGVHVVPGGGALVLARAQEGGAGVHALIDEMGRRFGLPTVDAGEDDVLARLGYTPEQVTVVPPAWAELFETGPDLTVEAALTPVAP